jgi:hypothetical protein
MRPRPVIMPAALLGLGLAGTAVAGPVNLRILSQSVAVDDANRTANFTVHFNHAPDFSVGPGGQVEAFQYEIDTKTDKFVQPISFDDTSTIVRGAEISAGKGLPIRARDGDGGPDSGGWGPTRGNVPFQLSGSTLSFTSSFDALGEDDGIFRYRIFTTDDGSRTQTVYASNPSQPSGVVVPVPPSAWSGLSMLGALGVARMRARWGKTRTRVI